VSLTASAPLLANLVALVLRVSLDPRVVLFLFLVVESLLLLVLGCRSRVVVDEGEGGLDGAFEVFSMQLHERGLCLAVKGLTDEYGDWIARHDSFEGQMSWMCSG